MAPPPRPPKELAAVDIGGVPLAAMPYYNLVYRTGHRRFARPLADGVGAAILPDLPLEELAAGARGQRPASPRSSSPRPPPRTTAPSIAALARLRLLRGRDGRHRRAATLAATATDWPSG